MLDTELQGCFCVIHFYIQQIFIIRKHNVFAKDQGFFFQAWAWHLIYFQRKCVYFYCDSLVIVICFISRACQCTARYKNIYYKTGSFIIHLAQNGPVYPTYGNSCQNSSLHNNKRHFQQHNTKKPSHLACVWLLFYQYA